MPELPWDYIRGLVEGEGTFTFSTRPKKMPDGSIIREKIPAFAIQMHERDEELLKMMKNTLGLTNKIYNYAQNNGGLKDGYKRGRKVVLIVRERDQIRDIVIPFFYKKLHGNKGKQFREWLEKMGDPDTSRYSKSLYRLYKSGHYDKSWNKVFD